MIIGTARAEECAAYDSREGYHQFHSEETQELYGSFEVYWHAGGHMVEPSEDDDMPLDDWRDPERAGWYWRACFPGCLPDGDSIGPFARSSKAFYDADEWHPDNADDGSSDDRDPLLDDRAAGYQ
jgi:hypothetical protein|tara:strand:- start:459 stop:833 length:375 start_codon:yes stop_codon:yes gene_type:complete